MNKIIDQEIVNVSEFSEDGQENALEAVTFTSNVKDIRRGSFKMCKKLRVLNFEEGVEKIGEAAFFGCESLKELCFPNSLKEIGSQAFRRCLSLEKVKLADSLLLAIPEDVFADCPCEDELRERRTELTVQQTREREKNRVLQYNKFFNDLFTSVMVGRNLDYTAKYQAACEEFKTAAIITAESVDILKKLYQVEWNRVASVGQGCMDVQFANYNRKHDGVLTWEKVDKTCLADVAMKVKGISAINEEALREIEELWRRFREVVGNLNLRQVFTRLIASLRPDLTVPVVHPEAMDELYGWFRRNDFVLEDDRLSRENSWLRNWVIQNNQIKLFLTDCLGKGQYEIGPFVWYFVEAFREGEQARSIVVERQKLIRNLITGAGYASPLSWKEVEEGGVECLL